MRWYDHHIDCEYCGEEFESSRQDARFCSSKCRTAHHRREKRREQAAASMAATWDTYTQSAYASITGEVPAAADEIKDIYINHSAAAAAAAVKMAHSIMSSIINRMENRLHQKDLKIESLMSDRELLHHIKSLVNS